MSGTFRRSDVVLADLDDFLGTQRTAQTHTARIVLAVASETSSLLPCCGQSLGFKNAQISKLWSAAHWKNDSCRLYWKDAHLVCVRQYRPNSTYASSEEVVAVTGDSYEFLHELPLSVSPLRRVSSKTILVAKTPSSATLNHAVPRTLRTVSSHSKLGTASPRSPSDGASPLQKQNKPRTSARPRVSEPAVSGRMPMVRSPIVTRRRSNTALHAAKVSSSPPPVPSRDVSTRSPSVAKPLARKASDSSIALKPRPRVSTGATRSVSGSAIPTPVRRISLNLLECITQDSPGSPIEQSKALRASQRRTKASSSMVSASTQTEPEQDPLVDELVHLEEEFDRLKREHETTLAYVRELGLENQRLRKQKGGIAEEADRLKEYKKELEGTVRELKKTNANLLDENGWIVICKTEQEEKAKQLEMENEKLAGQYAILSNQRKELELNDALDEISRLQVQAAAAQMSCISQPVSTPLKTPVTRFKEALDGTTVYKTPYLTPIKQTERIGRAAEEMSGSLAPVLLTPKIGSVSARKVRTPLSGHGKGQKHGLGFWKRMAKRRMFA